jgi:pSer/pThr/pTyr-binding forkhead associated (FHA) protein
VRLRFRVKTAPNQEGSSELDRAVDVEPAGDEVRIGRRAGLEIQLPFATISSLHARVVKHGGGWALLDMGSVNGTWVGEHRLQVGIPRAVKPGDMMKLADVALVFEGELGAAPPAKGTESTATIARRLVNDLFQAVAGAEVARVVVESGSSAGKAMQLAVPDRSYKVGRSPECDLVLTDEDVSREHAVFERRWQGVFVKDLGSKNGIEVDGKKVRGERRVHDGEVVLLGSIQLKVDDPEERYLRQMEEAKEKDAAARKPAEAPAAAAARAGAAGAAGAGAAGAAGAGAAAGAKPGTAAAAKPEAGKPAGAAAEAAKAAEAGKAGAAADAGKAAEAAKAAEAGKAGAAPDAGKEGKDAKAPGKDAKEAKASKPPKVDTPSREKDDLVLAERTSRVFPFFITVFSLAVLGGVGYLVWMMLFGITSGAPP